jgi:hypothetical protein
LVLPPKVLSSIVIDYYGPHADPRLQYVKQLGSKPLGWSRLKQLEVGTTVWIAPVARPFRRNVLAEQAVVVLSYNDPTEDAYLQFRIVEPRNGRYYQKHSRPAPDGHGLILSLTEHSWFQPRVFECTQVGDMGKPLAHADLSRVPPMTHLLARNREVDDLRHCHRAWSGVLMAAKSVDGDIEVTIQWAGMTPKAVGHWLVNFHKLPKAVDGDAFWLGPTPDVRTPGVTETTFRLSKNQQLEVWRDPSFSAPPLLPQKTEEADSSSSSSLSSVSVPPRPGDSKHRPEPGQISPRPPIGVKPSLQPNTRILLNLDGGKRVEVSYLGPERGNLFWIEAPKQCGIKRLGRVGPLDGDKEHILVNHDYEVIAHEFPLLSADTPLSLRSKESGEAVEASYLAIGTDGNIVLKGKQCPELRGLCVEPAEENAKKDPQSEFWFFYVDAEKLRTQFHVVLRTPDISGDSSTILASSSGMSSSSAVPASSSAMFSSSAGPSSPSRSIDTKEGGGDGLSLLESGTLLTKRENTQNFAVDLGAGFTLECGRSKEKLLQPSGETVAITLCNPAGQKIECRCTSAGQIKSGEALLRLATKHYDLLEGLTGTSEPKKSHTGVTSFTLSIPLE